MVKKTDLHIHTTCSDGVLSPKQVIDQAVLNKVGIISITDHDTIEAYNTELYQYAHDKNIKIISGVEISTKGKKCGIHILGYHFNIKDKQFLDQLLLLRNSRHDYLYNVAKKLTNLGYILNVTKLDQIEAVTKAHIALDIINNQQNNDLLLKTFRHMPTKGEFIEAIMNEGCLAYVEKKTLTPKQASDMIKKAGGKVVLAHPVAYFYEDGLHEEDILEIVSEIKPDGVETYYLYVDCDDKKINDIDKWNEFANKNNLCKTIGSDFHVSDGVRPEIGLDYTQFSISESELKKIVEHLES